MSKKLLIIDDDVVLNTVLSEQLRRMGYETASAHRWSEGEALLAGEGFDLILLDLNLPDANGLDLLPALVPQQPVIILTAHATVPNAVRAIKAGAYEYLVKPVNLDELDIAVSKALEIAAIKREHRFVMDQMAERTNLRASGIVGSSPAIRRIKDLIAVVAQSDMTVLIHGESGVGKELVAAAVHQASMRAAHAYVTFDCCTVQMTLFESELFGHEKGSFTSADRQKKGIIEGADNGTVFLDEIGEIEVAMQAKLLRLIETGKYRRLGSTRDLSARVRFLAATNRDLAQMVKDGSFRADLFYRLNAFTIEVPPLRERREDIPMIAGHFIRNHDFSRRINKDLHPETVRILMAYDWPGNVRELRNAIERAVILSGASPVLTPDLFPLGAPEVPRSKATSAQDMADIFAREPTLEDLKAQYIDFLLKKYDGHRNRVSRILGISERNTYRILNKLAGGSG